MDKWKLTQEEKDEMKRLFIEEGWNQRHLMMKYGIKQESVYYHVKDLIRIVPVLTKPPEEIRYLFNKPKKPKTYKDYLKEVKIPICTHPIWTKRCGCCGEIIDNEVHKVALTAISLTGV